MSEEAQILNAWGIGPKADVLLALARRASLGSGGRIDSLLWRPAGGGDVATFAQVAQAAESSPVPIDVWCDPTGSPGCNIPMAPVPYALAGKVMLHPTPNGGVNVVPVTAAPGAVVQDLSGINGSLIQLVVAPALAAPAPLVFTQPLPIFSIVAGASIKNNGARAAFDLGVPTAFAAMILAAQTGGQLLDSASTAALANFTDPASKVLVSLAQGGVASAGWATGTGGTNADAGILYQSDGSGPPFADKPQLPGYAGNVYADYFGSGGLVPNQGRTHILNPYPGLSVFDVLLGTPIPIWRNAANSGWVDATGAPALRADLVERHEGLALSASGVAAFVAARAGGRGVLVLADLRAARAGLRPSRHETLHAVQGDDAHACAVRQTTHPVAHDQPHGDAPRRSRAAKPRWRSTAPAGWPCCSFARA